MSAFIDSLVNKTNPNPFHQLFMLSQGMINNSFSNMWILAPPESNIRTFKMSIKGAGSIDSKLLAPRVVLHATELSPQLYYILEFESGNMSLYVSNDDEDNTKKDFNMKGWIFAFPVDIKRVNLDPEDPDFKKYKEEMGNPQGIFSLAQLLLDSSKAASWEKKLSSFGGLDWMQETGVIRANFGSFIDRWLNLMSASGKTVIGIALQTTQPATVNPSAPTFPPTSLDRYVYPWLDPINRGKPVDGLDSNALAYLMMTSDALPPSPPVLNYSGTFVDGTVDHGGLICMNAAQFWTSWFLKLTKELNKVTEIQPTEPICETDNWGAITVAPRMTIGWNAAHPSSDDVYFDYATNPSGGWMWDGNLLEANKETKAPDGGWLSTVNVRQQSTASSKIAWDRGGQKIALTGLNRFVFTVKQTGTMSGPFKTESSFTIETNWHLNFALGVVSDGGLQIARVPDPPGTDAVIMKTENSNEGIDWNINWGDYTDAIKTWIENVFGASFGRVENALQQGLANQHKLFLPASGTFLMQDAMFSARGDLLAFLHYNGATPPGVAPSRPGYLKKLPAREPRKTEAPLPKPQPVVGPIIEIPGPKEKKPREPPMQAVRVW